MTDGLRVILEIGRKRRVIAGAMDWPGLERWGTSEDEALGALGGDRGRDAAGGARGRGGGGARVVPRARRRGRQASRRDGSIRGGERATGRGARAGTELH